METNKNVESIKQIILKPSFDHRLADPLDWLSHLGGLDEQIQALYEVRDQFSPALYLSMVHAFLNEHEDEFERWATDYLHGAIDSENVRDLVLYAKTVEVLNDLIGLDVECLDEAPTKRYLNRINEALREIFGISA